MSCETLADVNPGFGLTLDFWQHLHSKRSSNKIKCSIKVSYFLVGCYASAVKYEQTCSMTLQSLHVAPRRGVHQENQVKCETALSFCTDETLTLCLNHGKYKNLT